MKKLIGTVAVAALLASAAFAELSISGGATQVWSPVAYNGGDVMTGTQCPWGDGRAASVGFTWVSEDEKAGAQFAIIYNPWSKKNDGSRFPNEVGISPDGNKLIWLKPWDFLKLSLGHWDGINDIQVANTASWDWIRPSTWLSFKGVRTDNLYAENEDTGVLIELTPVENLMVRVGLPFANEKEVSYHMFEALTADVEYTITDLLGIKLGWRGGRYSYAAPWGGYADYKVGDDWAVTGEVDAFLSLVAVENLQLDVGARIAILDTDLIKPADADKVLIGLKAGYNINEKFNVKADFAVKISEIADPSFAFGVGVGVGLTDTLSLDADFRGVLPGAEGEDPTFSFLVGVQYACSTNASIGIGFQGKTNGGNIGPLSANGDNFGFAVPVRVSVNF